MTRYNLITLSAKTILAKDGYSIIKAEDGNWEVVFRLNLNDGSLISRSAILSEDLHNDNALFYQIRKQLTEGEEGAGEDFLINKLLFIDFGELFNSTNLEEATFDDYRKKKKEELEGDNGLGYRLRWLFDPCNGIQISFDGHKWVTFVPFDKSNSMARNARISFIDKSIKSKIDKRLLLDIDFRRIEVVYSKFYSYRGLYLSSGYRIDSTKTPDECFILNQETVIVIEDKTQPVLGTIYSAKKINEDTETWYEFYEKNNHPNELNSFDGEGIICPQYAEYINKYLRNNYKSNSKFKKESTSFQIRMPFTKGMLHQVDFHQFFYEQFDNNTKWNQDTPLIVEDIYDQKRDLRKAKIILTKSMFKCWAWLEQWQKLKGIEDPMQYYFEAINKYDHALYVTNVDAMLSNFGSVPLNYQFLSTLAIKDEDFDSMLEWHINRIKQVPQYFLNYQKHVDQIEEADDIEIVRDDESPLMPDKIESARDKCLKALARNKAFISEPRVKDIIKEEEKRLAKNLCLGRLEVAGEQRFLSCDLLELLRCICEDVKNVKFDGGKNEELKKQRLYSNHFYMPEKRMHLKADKFYGLLRNPHLSRNEQCVLRPYVKAGSIYERYFSHLKGIVMLSVSSLVPMALSGADFDGDLVKITCDRRVVQAIKQEYEIDKKKCERKRAVIAIPSPNSGLKGFDTGTIPFKTIKDTFSNKVGLVSNIAVRIAKNEYKKLEDKGVESGKEVFTEDDKRRGICCAGCTVIVGLEIDAAKTGVHPIANIRALRNEKKEKSLYLDTKNNIIKIKTKYYTPIVKEDKDEEKKNKIKKDKAEDNILLSMYLSKKAENAKKAWLKKIPVYIDVCKVANIDRLPGEYLKFLKEAMETSGLKFKEDKTEFHNPYFKFELEETWNKNLIQDKKEQLLKVLQAYLKIKSLAWRVNRFRERGDNENNIYMSYIDTLLRIQYDGLFQKLSCGVEVKEALEQTFSEIQPLFDENIEKVQEAIGRLVQEKWHYSRKEQFFEKIAVILGIEIETVQAMPPAVIELLTNFRNKGFMLFYYLLKCIQNNFEKEMDADAYIKIEEIKEKSKYVKLDGNDYYNELYLLFSQLTAKKKDYRQAVVNKCREYVTSIFLNDMDEALKYVFAFPKKEDPRHDFLWNIFNEDEILRNVYNQKKAVKSC